MEIIIFEITQNKSFMIGQTLQNRYQIISELGKGAFGVTYLAKDLQMVRKTQCVVKKLISTEQEIIIRFKKEAETLEGLDHDQIPKLLAYFEENNEHYIVQEYIEGEDLTKEFKTGNQYSENDVIKFLKEVLPILVYVHQNNIIHRDIKPGNIMRTKKDNKLVLIDFGIIKEVATQINSQGETILTVVGGTPGFMPAEQLIGKPKLSSDIYALGITAIQFLTGIEAIKLPSDPVDSEIIWEYKLKVDGSKALKNIINKMVKYDFKDRYQNAAELLKDVEKLGTNIPIFNINRKNLIVLLSAIIILILIPVLGQLIDYIKSGGKPPKNNNNVISKPINYLTEPKYEEAYNFNEGLARIKIKDKFGYINNKGIIVIPAKYDEAGNFNEGVAWVKIGNTYSYINKNGNDVINANFGKVYDFKEGVAWVKIDNKYSYINKNGQRVKDNKFDPYFLNEGLAKEKINGKFGYKDTKGNLVISAKYTDVGNFHEGLAWVKIDIDKTKKYGFINKKSELVIPAKYEAVDDFNEGLAKVQIKNKKWIYINEKNEKVIPNEFDYAYGFNEELALVGMGNKYGYIDQKGNQVIDFQFDDAVSFREGLARVKRGKKWVYINKKGNQVIDFQFDDAGDFKEGIAAVKINNKWGYIRNPLR